MRGPDYYAQPMTPVFFRPEELPGGGMKVFIRSHLPRTMFFCELVKWCQEHDVEMHPTHLIFQDKETYTLFKLTYG